MSNHADLESVGEPQTVRTPVPSPGGLGAGLGDRSLALADLLRRRARFAAGSLERARARFGKAFEVSLEETLGNLFPQDENLEQAVAGYARFALDSMRRQRRFECDGYYPPCTYEEATQEVYLNSDYMRSQYLPGLLLSHYLWPHHFQQLQYFRHFFCEALLQRPALRFAEVAVGTGMYSRTLLTYCPQASGFGFDISPEALTFTGNHVEAFKGASRYQTQCCDILTAVPEHTYEAIICVELLEHLPNPIALLRALRQLAQPEALLFVTAALNAAHADHIYLYREPADVLRHVHEADFHVESMFLARAYAPTMPETPVPSVLAMVLRPRAPAP